MAWKRKGSKTLKILTTTLHATSFNEECDGKPQPTQVGAFGQVQQLYRYHHQGVIEVKNSHVLTVRNSFTFSYHLLGRWEGGNGLASTLTQEVNHVATTE